MADLQEDIATFDAMRNELETKHLGKWVLIHDRKFIGSFKKFDDAAHEAVRRFGRGPYLIREVGAASISLPASVMYRVEHA